MLYETWAASTKSPFLLFQHKENSQTSFHIGETLVLSHLNYKASLGLFSTTHSLQPVCWPHLTSTRGEYQNKAPRVQQRPNSNQTIISLAQSKCPYLRTWNKFEIALSATNTARHELILPEGSRIFKGIFEIKNRPLNGFLKTTTKEYQMVWYDTWVETYTHICTHSPYCHIPSHAECQKQNSMFCNQTQTVCKVLGW